MSTGRNGVVLNDQGGNRMDVTHDVTCTLRAEAHHPPLVLDAAGFCTEHSSNSHSIGYEKETAPTLRAGVVPATVYENLAKKNVYAGPIDAIPVENHPTDGRIRISDATAVQTLTSRMGTGGNNVPLVMKIRSGCSGGGKGPLIQTDKSATLACNNDQTLFVPKVYGISSKDSNGMKSANPCVGFYEADTVRTLDANGGNPTCNQGGTAVVECPTYSMTTGSFLQCSEDVAPTVLARDYKDPTTVCYGIGRDTFNQGKNAKFNPTFVEDLQPTLVAKGPGAIQRGYTVRRLTPTECARLQGFPDWWCADLAISEPTDADIAFWTQVWDTYRSIVSPGTKPKTEKQIRKWLADPHSDAAEYKMWGNGVCLNNVVFVLSGIVYCTQKDGR